MSNYKENWSSMLKENRVFIYLIFISVFAFFRLYYNQFKIIWPINKQKCEKMYQNHTKNDQSRFFCISPYL